MDSRKAKFDSLIADLNAQRKDDSVEIRTLGGIAYKDGGPTRGAKRQALLEAATGDFIVFRDDVDSCPPDYFECILPHCIDGVDCIGHLFDCYGYVRGNPKKVELACVSNRFTNWAEHHNSSLRYTRCPHHLVPVRREHALTAGFDPKMDNGEDFAYSMRLQKLGVLRNEVYLDKVLYTITHDPNKKAGT
mgnify:FL=1